MEEMAGLNLMQWNYHISEEDNVLLTKRNRKSGDNAGQNIKQF